MVEGIALPDRFTDPFDYQPDPLCVRAKELLCTYLNSRSEWATEIAQGKMFGVLVVEREEGEVGFITAFSGNLLGENHHQYFVPPIFDLLSPDGFFRQGESHITSINDLIEQLNSDPEYLACCRESERVRVEVEEQLQEAQDELRRAKRERDELRRVEHNRAVLEQLIAQSQHQKAEFRRLQRSLMVTVEQVQSRRAIFEDRLNALRNERRTLSARLQREIFDGYRELNAKGECRTMSDIFLDRLGVLPPAGAGECAAPKMLQYAYKNSLRHVSMAEFWWGV